MHGRSRGNVMILRANRAVARFFPYSFSPFSLCQPPVPPSLFRPLPRFPLPRDKTAQVGFRDKTEKATPCICVLEIILS